MKRELFRCDYCDIEKFNSETQQYENVPFVCETLAHWKQHIKRIKHCMNVERNKNLEDDLVVECKHCNGIFTQAQYKQHKEKNQLLWGSKGLYSYYKDCSCNNFCYGKKRFESLQELREYAMIKEKYSYGKDKKINYTKKEYERALQILQNRQEHEDKLKEIRLQNEAKLRKELEDKKEKLKKELEEKQKKKNSVHQVNEKKVKEKEIDTDSNNITMTIEEEFNELNGIEEKEDPKTDLNIPPVWDSEDICCECGKPDNSFREYSDQKLKNYGVSLCDCGDSDSDYE